MTRALALAAAMLTCVVSATGCFGPPCECDSETIPIPDVGRWEIPDIRVDDDDDGGASDRWEWDSSSPWGDVIEGELDLDGGTLIVEYTTDQGTFRVELEESTSEGW